ncbi:protein PROCA1 isoform X11 [Tamandua tetradactyla]|uniref:protein PROCA1 isoform X11 n=1 Tax=Tamandua tetradactyla TaxID=48850 RepID=UPI004053868F
MHLPFPRKVNSRKLTGVAGNTSNVLGTSSTPSPLTTATATCTCTLSATVTVIPGFLLWALRESRRHGRQAESPVCGSVKECSEKANSCSSQDADQTCSRDVGSTCFNIIPSPCFELIPEEECVERVWYGWCKSYRPISVAVIHHPIHHEFGDDDLNEEEEEEEEERKPPIPTQVGPTATRPDIGPGTVTGIITGSPDSAAPITIWRSESPTGKSQGSKVIKKVKKKKEKEKDKEEETDEKAKLKKKVKKGKLTKKKSPVKSESSPPDLSRSLSPRELARMSESSPESPGSEDSYHDAGQEEPSSEDTVAFSAKKREKNTVQAKKNGPKVSQGGKVIKRKSPPVSNPNLS